MIVCAMFRVPLPEDLAPTFKGVAVRYVYYFKVSARVVDLGVKMAAVEESGSDGRSSPTPSEAPSTSSRVLSTHSMVTSSQEMPRRGSLGSLFFRGSSRPNSTTVGKLLNSAESYAWREVNLRVPIHIWPPQVIAWLHAFMDEVANMPSV